MLSFILCVVVGVLVGYFSVVVEASLAFNPVNLGSSNDQRVSTAFFVTGVVFTIVCCALNGLSGGLAALIGLGIAGIYWLRK